MSSLVHDLNCGLCRQPFSVPNSNKWAFACIVTAFHLAQYPVASFKETYTSTVYVGHTHSDLVCVCDSVHFDTAQS